MPPPLELTGARFGRLLVVTRAHKDNQQAWTWLCRCDCGREVHVRGATLKAGKTSACASCATSMGNRTHGSTGTPLYERWRAMLNRCENPNQRAWKDYGGRGIKVCDEWHQFEAFARDIGPTFEPHLELDRINVDGHYEPGNCRWATRREQQNNRRNNHLITWREHTQTVYEWAVVLGLKPNTLLYRIRRGWSLDRAMTYGVPMSVLLQIANQEDKQ